MLAGRDGAQARAQLGSLTGLRAVLDTPVVLDYLGTPSLRKAFEQTVAAARTLGVDVVVGEHTIDEARSLCQAMRVEHEPRLRSALANGGHAHDYAALVDHTFLETFVTACQERRYRGWNDLEAAVLRLPDDLAGLGVHIRPHGNGEAQAVGMLADILDRRVGASSARPPARRRSRAAIERDAHTLTMVRRWRRASANVGSLPAAVIITPDNHLAPSLRQLDRADRGPVTLTMAQWAALCAVASPPPSLGELAQAAATLLTHEVMLRVAVRYPPEVALEYAQSLRADAPGRATDLRVAQLRENYNEWWDPETGRLVGDLPLSELVSRRRSQRARGAQQVARDRDQQTLQRARDAAAVAEVAKAQAEAEAVSLRADLERAQQERGALQSELGQVQRQATEEPKRTSKIARRTAVVSVLATLSAIMMIVGFAFGEKAAGTLGLVGLVAVVTAGLEWVHTGRRLWASFAAVLADLVGILSFFR